MTLQFHPENVIPTGDWVWVFASNEAGKHAKGVGKIARVNFRAEFGVGSGPTGHAYAIPTQDKRLKALPLDEVARSIKDFLVYAQANPKTNFFVTRIGLADGHSDDGLGILFADAPANCSLPEVWKQYVAQKNSRPTGLDARRCPI